MFVWLDYLTERTGIDGLDYLMERTGIDGLDYLMERTGIDGLDYLMERTGIDGAVCVSECVYVCMAGLPQGKDGYRRSCVCV